MQHEFLSVLLVAIPFANSPVWSYPVVSVVPSAMLYSLYEAMKYHYSLYEAMKYHYPM